MQGFLRGAAWGLAALVVVAQFIRPARTNPAIVPGHALEDVVSVPPAVEAILTKSCADCHSDRTRWPWYSEVSPISWFLADHVREGRRHLNISEWVRPGVDDPVKYTTEKFHSACRQVQSGDMPLLSYLLIHRDARLNSGEAQLICVWADNVMPRPQTGEATGR